MTSHAAAAVPGASPARVHPGSERSALMSIGEVLAELRTEFPDTTISKLRFLEAEGLVRPQRTQSGYRKYTWNDVARLRYVLTAQRDHYLPLRVIREHLERGGETGGWPRPALVTAGEPVTVNQAPAEVRLSRAELLARVGVDDSLLTSMEQHGLLAPRSGGWYDSDALTIAESVRDLSAYGLEPRHLRTYRSAADREVGLFAQLVAPLLRQAGPGAQARAAEAVRELTGLSRRLHTALVRAGLRQTLGR